jgi:DNA-binding GntR family transcriptional regulator
MKTVSAVDVAKKYLEEKIVSSNLLPGQQIKEGDISRQLNISRPPIREAFKILEAGGLVTRTPNKGVFVSKVTVKDIWEVYTLKEALYTLAFTLALEVISEKDIKKLEKNVLEMEACLESTHAKTITRCQNLNSQFHNLFRDLSNHQRLKTFLSNLDIQTKRISYQAFTDKNHMRQSLNDHRNILAAIQQNDKKKALDLMVQHVREVYAKHKQLAQENSTEEYT